MTATLTDEQLFAAAVAIGEGIGRGCAEALSKLEEAIRLLAEARDSGCRSADLRSEMGGLRDQITENTSKISRVWERFEGDGLTVRDTFAERAAAFIAAAETLPAELNDLGQDLEREARQRRSLWRRVIRFVRGRRA